MVGDDGVNIVPVIPAARKTLFKLSSDIDLKLASEVQQSGATTRGGGSRSACTPRALHIF